VNDLTIHPLTPDDRQDWARLWAAYLDYYETAVSPEVYDTTFARLLRADAQEFNGLIARRGGRAIGLTHYLFHRHAWKIENVCYLQDLYCAPEARGTGVGRALIEAVYSEADKAGAPAVYWLTQSFNDTARRLYDRVGTLTPFIKYARR